MADSLNGKVFATDAAVAGFGWEFTVDLAEVQKYEPAYTLENCAIQLKLYPLADRAKTLAPLSITPALTLSLGQGLTRVADDGNQPDTQYGTLVITPQQSATLLGDATYRLVAYQWRVEVGGVILASAISEGYDGRFGLALPGYTAEALERLRG
jgi:hypothetical protein